LICSAVMPYSSADFPFLNFCIAFILSCWTIFHFSHTGHASGCKTYHYPCTCQLAWDLYNLYKATGHLPSCVGIQCSCVFYVCPCTCISLSLKAKLSKINNRR
jgi:hypothetical protein